MALDPSICTWFRVREVGDVLYLLRIEDQVFFEELRLERPECPFQPFVVVAPQVRIVHESGPRPLWARRQPSILPCTVHPPHLPQHLVNGLPDGR